MSLFKRLFRPSEGNSCHPSMGETYLEKHPSEFYLNQLEKDRLVYHAFREAGIGPGGVFGPEVPEHFSIEIDGPIPFFLKIYSCDGNLPDSGWNKAIYILSNIVEMDKVSHNESQLREYHPELFDIVVEDEYGRTIFSYIPGKFNSEWEIEFLVCENSWTCKGMM